MQRFKQKQQLRKRLYSKPVLFILIIILGLIIHGAWGIWKKSKQSQHTLEVAQSELDRLKEREGSIEKRIERLGTETGIEEEIRSKFDVVKEGENIIVIIEDEELPPVIEEKPGVIKGIFTTVKSWFR